MKDRLDQIWDGFSKRSQMDLRGVSLETTPRPELSQKATETSMGLKTPLNITALPEGAADPVGAALGALHQQLAEKSHQKSKPQEPPSTVARFTPPPSAVETTLLADLAFTESKTNRSPSDYLTYAAGRQEAWQRKKRKKFLGLF
ncbi:MAG: hypothetical protein AAF603_00275 [Pseudomonadota bacterium]